MAVYRLLGIAFAAFCLAQGASSETFSCQVGKPSYCFKYGGALCEKWNARSDTPKACAKWTEACIDCHNDIPDCFGHHRPPADSALCSRCRAQWRACMARIDARFWPNRMSEHN